MLESEPYILRQYTLLPLETSFLISDPRRDKLADSEGKILSLVQAMISLWRWVKVKEQGYPLDVGGKQREWTHPFAENGWLRSH